MLLHSLYYYYYYFLNQFIVIVIVIFFIWILLFIYLFIQSMERLPLDINNGLIIISSVHLSA